MKCLTACMILIALAVSFIGCRPALDSEELRSEILAIHEELIDAHLNKDVDFFVRDLSDEFISVSNGEIETPSAEELRARFTDYLGNTTFSEYRYLREPIIGSSKDGSIAWSIVQVKAVGERTMDDGTVRELDFICAWITLYERRDNGWIKVAEVSNFK